MPRQRARRTDINTRLRNMTEILGRPGLAGLSRVGGQVSGANGGPDQSVLLNVGTTDTTASVGQVLVLSATADSIASGGDYLTFDEEVYRHGFAAAVSADDVTVTWPISFAGGFICIEWAWDSYQGGGTIEIEVDGEVPGWGEVVSGASGQTVVRSHPVHLGAGQAVKIKATQSSGSAQTVTARVSFVAPDPADKASMYAAVVLADSPLAYWRLGESSGTSATDETGNGYTCTYSGSPTLGALGIMRDGSGNTAVDFDGTDDYAAGSDWDALEFAGTASFTIEAWVNHDGAGNAQGLVVKTYSYGPGDVDGWTLFLSGTTVGIGRSNRTTIHTAEASLTAGVTAHVVGTYDGTTLRLYVDGALAASDATAVSIPSHTGILIIGNGNELAGPNSTNHFDGTIDEVAVYDFALSAPAIAKHYAIGSQAA